MKTRTTLILGSITFLAASQLSAQELFRDEMTGGAGWGMNANNADSAATFGYNYSADDIPEAPNSRGGDAAATGVKLEANLTTGSLSTFTLYPMGQSFTGDYQLRFDAWMNYDVDERINGGSAGTTEFLGGGIGYNGTSADVNSGAQAIATNDGGSGSDWRAFKDGFFIGATEMTAGSRNGFDPYYSDFLPGVPPPAGQAQVSFPDGTAGSPGFQWITWEFDVIGNTVSVVIEKPDASRLEIVSYDKTDTSDGSGAVETDGNISLFYADFFTSVTSRPDLTFGVIDNVEVNVVPEPTTAALALLGVASLFVSRRRK